VQLWAAPPGYPLAMGKAATGSHDASQRREYAELLACNRPPVGMPPPAMSRGFGPGRRRRPPGVRRTLRELSGVTVATAVLTYRTQSVVE